MARPDCKKGMKAIKNEFENFQVRGVWKIVKRNDVNKRALKIRWVFRIKEDVITGKTVYRHGWL